MTCKLASAISCGFTGGVIIDYPNSTKAKKFYLCINAGDNEEGVSRPLPSALGMEEEIQQVCNCLFQIFLDQHASSIYISIYSHWCMLFNHHSLMPLYSGTTIETQQTATTTERWQGRQKFVCAKYVLNIAFDNAVLWLCLWLSNNTTFNFIILLFRGQACEKE